MRYHQLEFRRDNWHFYHRYAVSWPLPHKPKRLLHMHYYIQQQIDPFCHVSEQISK
jgi:hypothetical protein